MEICKKCGETVEGNCSRCAVYAWSRQFNSIRDMRNHMDSVDNLHRYNHKIKNLKVIRLKQHIANLLIFAAILLMFWWFLDSSILALDYEDKKMDILRAHGVK